MDVKNGTVKKEKKKKLREIVLHGGSYSDLHSVFENDTTKIIISKNQIHLADIRGITKSDSYVLIFGESDVDTTIDFDSFSIICDEEILKSYEELLDKGMVIVQIDILFDNAPKEEYMFPFSVKAEIKENCNFMGVNGARISFKRNYDTKEN